ncbi:bacterio-opsin activator [Bacillota bacterium LX-D]|jgi:DNA-directed RNA polymerase specialized sigma24 family protein|nr:bacterio-opsin activator [Bacillota bacterium LX-D]
MKINDNQSQTRIYKIYLPHEKKWVEVTETQYYAYYRDIWATRKRAQAHRQCMCPKDKHWLCDGDCLICPFHAPGDSLSLDLTYENSDGEAFSMLDKLADSSASIEDVVTDQIVLDMLFQRLAEIMPEAHRIGDLRMAGMSDAEIADKIGVPRTTFLSRLKKAKELLQREYPDLF